MTQSETLDLFGPPPFRVISEAEKIARSRAAFDFNAEYKAVIDSVIKNCQEFSNFDPARIAVSYSEAKSRSKYGLQAKIYPLRFEGGSTEKIMRGHKFTVDPLIIDGNDILYVVSFCIPRFLNLNLPEKIETIVHELYHISPRFNGDIRRLSLGKNAAHGPNMKLLDKYIEGIARRYLYSPGRPILPKFLEYDYKHLKQVFGEILFTKIKVPKIITQKLEQK